MIGNAMTPALAETAVPKRPKIPNDVNRGPGCVGSAAGAAAIWSSETDTLHLKYTSKDGDVLELDLEHHEESFAGVAFAAGSPAGARAEGAADKGRPAAVLAGANTEAAAAAGEAADARLEKLARLRDWAAQVADEVRKQQKRILEEYLQRSGKFMPGWEGRFIVIHGAEEAESGANGDYETGIPEYWNAENTSDRIVHFATQMAEIAGKDSDFAKTIMQAVADGFDQANAQTGPLPGAAGELNKKTRELTFSKLSKWLDEQKSMGYNQDAGTEVIQRSEHSHGTQTHEQ